VRWLSPNPDKQWTERTLLAYSPVWMGLVALVMFSGLLGRWGDFQLMALGLGMALGPFAMALSEGRPHARRYVLIVTLHAFVQVYFGSKLFFDAFGMEYHFRVSPRWIWNGSPLFLYFMTVAYFATYYVLMGIGWRAFTRARPQASRLERWAVRAVLCYAVAFAETASMAIEIMRPYFSYRDPAWVMRWGSICYGTLFFITLPQLTSLDEDKATPETTWQLVRDALAANLLVLIIYELYGVAIRSLAPAPPPGC
jgi:hypothetical protein